MNVIEDLLFTVDVPMDFIEDTGFTGVGSDSVCSIRDVESLIDTDGGIKVDDAYVDGEVEEVEAGLGVIPCWVRDWADLIVDSSTEGGSQSQEDGGCEECPDLVPESTFTEFLYTGLLRDNDAKEDEW